MRDGRSAESDGLLQVHAAGLELNALLVGLNGAPATFRVLRAIEELDRTAQDLQVLALARAAARFGDLVTDGAG